MKNKEYSEYLLKTNNNVLLKINSLSNHQEFDYSKFFVEVENINSLIIEIIKEDRNLDVVKKSHINKVVLTWISVLFDDTVKNSL